MKVKLGELKNIIQEVVKEHSLDPFRKSEGFKKHLESIINSLNEFSSKTPVGFFDAYKREQEVDFYKSFHDFYEDVNEVYGSLFGSSGQIAHVGEKSVESNVENKLGETVLYKVADTTLLSRPGAEPDLDSWPKKKVEEYWDTLKKNYKSEEAKLSAVATFTANPEAFLEKLERRATDIAEEND